MEGGCWTTREIVGKNHESSGASRQIGSCRKSKKLSPPDSQSGTRCGGAHSPLGSNSIKKRRKDNVGR